MKKLTAKIISKLLPNFVNLLKNFRILAIYHGQWNSIKKRMAIDANGEPIPWYTYPALEYLKNFDFTQCDVFEFGAGNSSLYWASRSKSVVSVECNKAWYEIINQNIRDNQTLIFCPDELGYVGVITELNKIFDIIVIDGNHRLACTSEAIKNISKDGIIVLDNSDRIIERECSELLRKNGFMQIDFSGFGPVNGYCWSTSIFFKGNKLFLSNYSGPNPVGGLVK